MDLEQVQLLPILCEYSEAGCDRRVPLPEIMKHTFHSKEFSCVVGAREYVGEVRFPRDASSGHGQQTAKNKEIVNGLLYAA